METTYQRIIRKTGRKPISCKCVDCKKQCKTQPCLGTPDDIEKIIDAGYGAQIKETIWATGMLWGISEPIVMYQAENISGHGCTFFQNGLCNLHEKGLKPTEGKLSHHTIKPDNYNHSKHISWQVAKEWLNPDNKETIYRIKQKLSSVTA